MIETTQLGGVQEVSKTDTQATWAGSFQCVEAAALLWACPLRPSSYIPLYTPRYLNSSTEDKISSPTWRVQATFFSLRNHASDLKVLIFTLNCKLHQDMLKGLDQWRKQDIIYNNANLAPALIFSSVSVKTAPQHLKVLRANPIQSQCLVYLNNFSLADGWINLCQSVLSLSILYGRSVRGIEEILKVLLLLSDNVPISSPVSTLNSVGRVLLPPPRAPISLPKFLWIQPTVLFLGLPYLLPDVSFCLHNCPACSMLGLPVPISYLRNPTSYLG